MFITQRFIGMVHDPAQRSHKYGTAHSSLHTFRTLRSWEGTWNYKTLKFTEKNAARTAISLQMTFVWNSRIAFVTVQMLAAQNASPAPTGRARAVYKMQTQIHFKSDDRTALCKDKSCYPDPVAISTSLPNLRKIRSVCPPASAGTCSKAYIDQICNKVEREALGEANTASPDSRGPFVFTTPPTKDLLCVPTRNCEHCFKGIYRSNFPKDPSRALFCLKGKCCAASAEDCSDAGSQLPLLSTLLTNRRTHISLLAMLQCLPNLQKQWLPFMRFVNSIKCWHCCSFCHSGLDLAGFARIRPNL